MELYYVILTEEHRNLHSQGLWAQSLRAQQGCEWPGVCEVLSLQSTDLVQRGLRNPLSEGCRSSMKVPDQVKRFALFSTSQESGRLKGFGHSRSYIVSQHPFTWKSRLKVLCVSLATLSPSLAPTSCHDPRCKSYLFLWPQHFLAITSCKPHDQNRDIRSDRVLCLFIH